ncbi:DUF805 domain-containing protein [Agromyces sp. MMS24-JH15]|uniref:DUF805 domain-containing protein n=1 Tax=Agromyces sp. MMS24-JH15 TaxID=3243765 RepID=UPI0037486427
MSNATSTEPPLSAPLYGATFGQAVQRFFKKYATFSGRASRSEYWWWVLASVIVSTVFSLLISIGISGSVDPVAGTFTPGPLAYIGYIGSGLWALAILIPTLAVTWRRLHDTNRSGGFFFLALIPFVGPIIVLIFTLLPTDPAGARFDR